MFNRKKIKLSKIQPGMQIMIGGKLFRVRSVEDCGATIELAIQIKEQQDSRHLLGYLTFDRSMEIYISKK